MSGRSIGAALALLLLAGCSSFLPATPTKSRAIDFRHDDVASLVVAFDMPAGIRPVPETSTLRLALSVPGQGERQVTAPLGLADAADLAGTLPPPADTRTYFLFGFAPRDQAALREALAWARSAGEPAGALAVAPSFCRTGPADPAAYYSVQLALPGAAGLAPLLRNQPIAQAGGLPEC